MIKAVIVSAYGDMDNIRTAMNRGAFDFVTKPINFEDLEQPFNRTLGHVKQLHETFKTIHENNILRMYVDETVLKFIEPEGVRRAADARMKRSKLPLLLLIFVSLPPLVKRNQLIKW